MPDANINPDEGQVQPSPEATDEALSLDQLKAKSPDEILDLYNNAIEMRKSATQKFMETADERKRLEAEREYLLNDRQRMSDELTRAYDQMAQVSQSVQRVGQQQQQPSSRDFSEVPPDQVYSQLYEGQQKTQQMIDALKREYEEKINQLRGDIQVTRRKVEYDKFLEKEIYPKYRYVTEQKLDDWFTEHPNIDPNPKTVHLAADEINKGEDAKFEAEVQARLKAKAEKAKEAEVAAQSAPLGAIEGVDKFIELTPREQQEQIAKDIRRLQSLEGQ